jgi:UDP-GlcNAc:undecaprenyl-phosphate GlcNAc-1-phosphate transferase
MAFSSQDGHGFMNLVILTSFMSSIILSAGLTWSIRGLALRRKWLRDSLPSRHIHTVSMPRFGGVAISAAVIGISAIAMLSLWYLGLAAQGAIHQMAMVLAAAVITMAIGLVDDFIDVSAGNKILVEIIAGLLLWVSGIRILHFTSLFHNHQFGSAVSALLTICWVLLIANAFNLIDGLDGLAAGSALFSVMTVFAVSLSIHNYLQGVLAAILAGAILGFLRYNFNPATIYLGDCGSLFIGTLLAGLTLTGDTQQKSSTLVAVAIPIVAFGLPIVETSVSVIRRFLRGQPIFTADREHIHHKLLNLGWSQRQVVVCLYAISALFAVLSLALLAPGQAPLAIVLLVLAVGVVFGIQKLGYHEFFEIGRVARRALEQRQVIVNNLAVRRGAEKLTGCDSWQEIIEALEDTFATNDIDGFNILVQTNRNGVLCNHSWYRPESRPGHSPESLEQWSITIRLRDREANWDGLLRLSRFDSSDLLLDINLITSELRQELERSCQRLALSDELGADAVIGAGCIPATGRVG